jgi:O-antigen/teichoic acid export membrane protein
MKEALDTLKNDHLLNSSMYLTAASAVTALLGFVFWVLSARLFSSEQVGFAASLIAAMALVNTLTLFGFDVGIIRFWRRRDPKRLVGSCYLISGGAALLVAAGFALFYSVKFDFFSGAYPLLFIVLSAAWVIFNLNDSAYIGLRKSRYVLLKQAVFSVLKLGFPWLLLGLGFFGIFGSYSVSALIALIVVGLIHPIPFSFCVDLKLIRSVLRFSMYNYLSNVFVRTRELVLPLLVIYLLGAKHTAYFYLAFNVTLVFLLVPKAVSKALLAEASHQKKGVLSNFRKALMVSLLFATAVMLFLFVAGKYLLLLYGREYAQNSLQLLYLFAVVGVFATVNEIYYALMRVQLRLNHLLTAQVLNAVLTLGLAALLIGNGLVGIGHAWLISEVLVMLYVLAVYWRLNPIKVMLA